MNPLPHENLLTTIGEVSAAFVGLSLVVSLLRPGSAVDGRQFLAIRAVAEMGLIAIGASLVPLAIHAYGLSPGSTWRLSSILFVLAWILGVWFSFRRAPAPVPEALYPVRVMVLGVSALSLGLLSWNVVVPDSGSGARYATTLLLLLGCAGAIFIAATFLRHEDPPDA